MEAPRDTNYPNRLFHCTSALVGCGLYRTSTFTNVGVETVRASNSWEQDQHTPQV